MRLTGTIKDISMGFLDGECKLTLAVNEKNDLKLANPILPGDMICSVLPTNNNPSFLRDALNF